MNTTIFPLLDVNNWKETRNMLQTVAQLLSDIKGTLMPHQKNWEEYSLKVYAKGLTTTPIPVVRNGDIDAMDLNINFVEHKVKIFCGDKRISIDLINRSSKEVINEVIENLNVLKVEYKAPEKFEEPPAGNYNEEYVLKYWDILRHNYFALLEFKGSLLEETSSINFWAHHFDIAMLVFTGGIIKGQDINNWDYSREQMNFGFSTGDSTIPEPYFYITAYPFQPDAVKIKLPEGAYWHTEGWNGAIMKYNSLIKVEDPRNQLVDYFKYVKDYVFDLIKN